MRLISNAFLVHSRLIKACTMQFKTSIRCKSVKLTYGCFHFFDETTKTYRPME